MLFFVRPQGRMPVMAGLMVLAGFPAAAQVADTRETVVVTGYRERDAGTVVAIDADAAREQANAVNTEDLLKYAPSLLVRKRHYGDTQDPVATRTSGVGASARSLIFVDGILISSPIGNNNTSASPHFGIAPPQDVEGLQILYGPYSAAYAGGSMGAVITITTRMPDRFELYADALGAAQSFSQYGTQGSYTTGELSAGLGDRQGDFSWRLSANHLDSHGQPLAYVTLATPAASSSSGTAVTGADFGLNRTGAPIALLGAGGLEHQVQDTDTVKVSYLLGGVTASYSVSLFHQNDTANTQTYLNAAGTPFYAGTANIAGRAYAVPASAFSGNVYRWGQLHLAQGLTLTSSANGSWDWQLLVSHYDYLNDRQGVPSGALPAAFAGGAGTLTHLDGTGWTTLDAKGGWRGGNHDLSFGLHRDQENFSQVKNNVADWRSGAGGTLAALAKGKTATDAAWLEDRWAVAPDVTVTLGARAESWRAHDGRNLSAAPALDVIQPALSGAYVSPKAALAWNTGGDWTVSAAWGAAWRMPTVTELYQAITTGLSLSVPNPDLKPEHADTVELAAQKKNEAGFLRLALFREEVHNALLSQSAPLVPGSTTLYSYVQNVDRTRVQGVELSFDRKTLLADVELGGSVTYADGRVVQDRAFAAAIGKQLPQLPRWRATLAATWRPTPDLAVTLAGRAASRAYGTIDNSDPVAQTFQGFGAYAVADAKVQLRLDQGWTASAGVDNLTGEKYFLYHPFPQRTFVMELHYAH